MLPNGTKLLGARVLELGLKVPTAMRTTVPVALGLWMKLVRLTVCAAAPTLTLTAGMGWPIKVGCPHNDAMPPPMAAKAKTIKKIIRRAAKTVGAPIGETKS